MSRWSDAHKRRSSNQYIPFALFGGAFLARLFGLASNDRLFLAILAIGLPFTAVDIVRGRRRLRREREADATTSD